MALQDAEENVGTKGKTSTKGRTEASREQINWTEMQKARIE
jgi:hypothetical protein